MSFSQADILALIPQRPPFLYLSEVVAFEALKSATGKLVLTGQEDFFRGHFPENPVMPGVLILEHMAQTASFLMAKSNELVQAALEQPKSAGPTFAFGMINRARFLAPVIPPCEIITEVTAVKLMSQMGIIEAVSKVGDIEVAKAQMQFGALRETASAQGA